MYSILLCSHDPIFIKSVYGMLRDAGYAVEIVDHPARAVQRVLQGPYGGVIFDAAPFGLPVEDAAGIIRTVAPDLPVVVLGGAQRSAGILSLGQPVDLEEFKEAIHSIQPAGI